MLKICSRVCCLIGWTLILDCQHEAIECTWHSTLNKTDVLFIKLSLPPQANSRPSRIIAIGIFLRSLGFKKLRTSQYLGLTWCFIGKSVWIHKYRRKFFLLSYPHLRKSPTRPFLKLEFHFLDINWFFFVSKFTIQCNVLVVWREFMYKITSRLWSQFAGTSFFIKRMWEWHDETDEEDGKGRFAADVKFKVKKLEKFSMKTFSWDFQMSFFVLCNKSASPSLLIHQEQHQILPTEVRSRLPSPWVIRVWLLLIYIRLKAFFTRSFVRNVFATLRNFKIILQIKSARWDHAGWGRPHIELWDFLPTKSF
jgi:hypothetical protein